MNKSRTQICSDGNSFHVPSTVTSSQVNLNSSQAQQLFGDKPKNWTEKLFRFNSVCALLNERRWALLVAQDADTFELISATEEYGLNMPLEERKKALRPSLTSFPYFIDANKSKYILRDDKTLNWLKQRSHLSWIIFNKSTDNWKHLSGFTFIGRFWCHIPHFMEDLLAMLSVAYQTMLETSQRDLELRFILPEISLKSCVLGRNPYFRNILQISKVSMDEWNLSRVQFLFKEDVEEEFLLIPKNNSTMNATNRLLCFEQVLYNVRNVPRFGHDVLWVYNLEVISRIRKTTYNLIPFVWRLKYQQKFSVTLLQRKRTRRIINIESLATAIKDFFGVNTRIVYFEDTSFWYQVMVMKTTRVLVAAHGAGLTNVIYMRRGSAVIEISNFGCHGEPYFGTLSQLSGLLYWNWKPLKASKLITKLDRIYASGSNISPDNCTRWRKNAEVIVSEHDILEIVSRALIRTEHLS